jgi:uncharacterized protein YyaL (SSP411 family)
MGENNHKAAGFSNHLSEAAAPYLRQHAHNPVNWYPLPDGRQGENKAVAYVCRNPVCRPAAETLEELAVRLAELKQESDRDRPS